MLYISSACVRQEYIKDSVEMLARAGFKNIELSGGTQHYPSYEEDLLRLRDKFGLTYLLHNYFPPPVQDVILNLASLNEDIYQRSINHYLKAIGLSKELGAVKFGMHAGFFIDFSVNEIGRDISAAALYDRESSLQRFCEGFNYLKSLSGDVELYVENNVLSSSNAKEFRGQNPFMMTDFDGYSELAARINFQLLLDVGHLKVSAHSLGFDFGKELKRLFHLSDYIHVSDNDGLADQNYGISRDRDMFDVLKGCDFMDKTVTLETYEDLSGLRLSSEIMQELMV